MPRYVVLLRGVNLAGRNKLAMADLRKWLEAEGFTDVVTKGASGNAVVTSRLRSPGAVRDKVAAVVAKGMKKPIAVAVRSAVEMERVIGRAPFKGEEGEDELHVVNFLPDGETFAVVKIKGGKPDGYGKVDKEYQDVATTRSWKVVRELAALAQDQS